MDDLVSKSDYNLIVKYDQTWARENKQYFDELGTQLTSKIEIPLCGYMCDFTNMRFTYIKKIFYFCPILNEHKIQCAGLTHSLSKMLKEDYTENHFVEKIGRLVELTKMDVDPTSVSPQFLNSTNCAANNNLMVK